MHSRAMKYLAVAGLCLLCVAGCRKKDDELKVEVKNGTTQTIEDICITLDISDDESRTEKFVSLAPGESVTIYFPRVEGEGSFKVSGKQKGKAPYSKNVGYVENWTDKCLILFCPKPTPEGFEADFQYIEDEYVGGG